MLSSVYCVHIITYTFLSRTLSKKTGDQSNDIYQVEFLGSAAVRLRNCSKFITKTRRYETKQDVEIKLTPFGRTSLTEMNKIYLIFIYPVDPACASACPVAPADGTGPGSGS
jgi:hypothetical protein